MAENDTQSYGKKVFFLHPPVVLQNQVIPELAQEEFEVYAVKDETKLRQVLKKYPDSIVFAGINEGMREKAWEEWIRGVMGSPETEGVHIGVIASGADDNVRHRYVEQIKVRCGYTVIKADINALIKQLIAILNNVNAKGRRKYIRALIDGDTISTVNLPFNGTFINGTIKDVSVVGFSCSFKEDPELKKNSLFKDIQLRLQSQLLKAEGIVFGSRMDGSEKMYVILFTQRIDPDVRTRIRKYIQSNLQNKMDLELK
jgi:hypothetical protein